MSLDALQSRIPTPVSNYGVSSPQIIQKQVVYDGRLIPAFLLAHGGDPTKVREFLIANKIGSAFDMEAGIEVVIPVS